MDEGDFISAGMWLRNGDIFYVDTWNERGPIFYYFTAAYFLLASPTIENARLLALVLSCFQMLLLYAFARRCASPLVALLAPAFYLFAHAFFLGTLYLTEQLMGIPLLCVVLLTSQKYKPFWTQVSFGAAGFLLSCFILIKQSGVVFLVVTVGYVIWRIYRIKEGWSDLFFLLLGTVLPFLFFSAYYFSVGELQAFFWGLSFPFLEYNTVSYIRILEWTEYFLFVPIVLVVLGGIYSRFEKKWAYGVSLVVFLAGVAGVSAPSFYFHHILLWLLPFSISIAWITEEALRSKKKRIVKFGFLFIMISLFGMGVKFNWENNVIYCDSKRWDDIRTVSETIRTNTEPDEKIWVFPHECNVYLFSDRKSVSRFPFLLPWTASAGVLQEIQKDLESNPPQFIVYSRLFRNTVSGYEPKYYADEIVKYIVENYLVDNVTTAGLVLLKHVEEGQTLTHQERMTSLQLLTTTQLPHILTIPYIP